MDSRLAITHNAIINSCSLYSQFFDKDVDEFGFYEGEYHEGEFDEGAGREEMVESSC